VHSVFFTDQMSRLKTLALPTALLTTLYFLLFFQVFSIPFVDEDVVNKVVPVVSVPSLISTKLN
jgi:hypothetical protein